MIDRICSLLKMKKPAMNSGLLFASGTTVPTDATAGYQTGCIFIHTDGGAGTALYVNEGTETSCAFVSVAAPDTLINATPGTATASKAVILDSNVKIDRNWINLGSNHGVYVTSALTGLTKNAFRAGDYGTEIDVAAGYGLLRVYGKYTTGTDASTVGFIRALTAGAIDVSAIQLYADCDAGTPGPKNVHAGDFFAVINDTKYLAVGANLYDGLIASWHKVTAPVGAVINGNVWTIFLDNQMSAAVGGTEATILSMTGGTKPDAWAYFSTTSSGWSTLFTFDTAAAAQDPVATPAGSTPSGNLRTLKVQIGGGTYYLLAAATYS